jgi:uncharacterized protein YbjT (DUF2867 family)
VAVKDVVLVVGATGNQGGAAARHLLANGWRVRALTRDPAGAAAQTLASAGAELVAGDLDDRASLDRAVAGAHAVFSVQAAGGHQPGFSVDDEIRQGRAIADAAKDAGVGHFVYASVAGAEMNTGVPSWESKWQVEQYLHEVGLPTTVLLPVMFMENIRRAGPVGVQPDGTLSNFVPPNVPVQLIAVDDIGAFTALALHDPDAFVGRRIELAGDELTFREIAAALSAALHRRVQYHQYPLAAALGGDLASQERSAKLLEPHSVWRADIANLRVLHPRLQTFEDWLQRNAETFQSQQ